MIQNTSLPITSASSSAFTLGFLLAGFFLLGSLDFCSLLVLLLLLGLSGLPLSSLALVLSRSSLEALSVLAHDLSGLDLEVGTDCSGEVVSEPALDHFCSLVVDSDLNGMAITLEMLISDSLGTQSNLRSRSSSCTLSEMPLTGPRWIRLTRWVANPAILFLRLLVGTLATSERIFLLMWKSLVNFWQCFSSKTLAARFTVFVLTLPIVVKIELYLISKIILIKINHGRTERGFGAGFLGLGGKEALKLMQTLLAINKMICILHISLFYMLYATFQSTVHCCIDNYNYVIRFIKPFLGHQQRPRPLPAGTAAIALQEEPRPLRQLLQVRQEGRKIEAYDPPFQAKCHRGCEDGLHDRWALRVHAGLLLGRPDQEIHGHTYLDHREWRLLWLPPRMRIGNSPRLGRSQSQQHPNGRGRMAAGPELQQKPHPMIVVSLFTPSRHDLSLRISGWQMWACIFINNFYLSEAVLYCYSSNMKQSSIILLSIFFILGLYIFGSLISALWFGPSQDCQYNIGCYLAVHSLNHTDDLLARISDLQHASNMSQMQLAQRNFPLVQSSDLHNKSVQLALSFEKYIKKLTQQHDYNLQNVQILREIARAEKEYLSCKKLIDQSYSQEDCSNNWGEYVNCSKRMDKVRSKLSWLTDQERIMQDQIAEMIKMPNNSISALDLAKKIYNDSMKANEKLKADLSNRLTPLQKLLRTKTYDRDEALQKYQLTFKNNRQCQQNKKKHTACQEISKQVRNINSDNIAYLKVMINSKEELLKNLQRILDSQKNSKEIEELNEKYHKHKDEYINMFKEFISLTRENQKACGCTVELEIELKKELELLRNKATSLNVEISALNDQIARLNEDLEKCDQQREEIVRKYKKVLEDNEKPTESQTELSKINRGLKAKYTEILELRLIYSKITSQCDQIKTRLGLRVQDINKINECISKKNYFLELKRQTAPYIHSDKDELNRMLESKKELAHFLATFTEL